MSTSAAMATTGSSPMTAASRAMTSCGVSRRKETGTTVTFLPDSEIFEAVEFDFTTLQERMRDTAFLTRGLRIVLTDEREAGHRIEFKYDGGIVDFVAYLNRNKEAIQRKIISFSGETEEGQVEVAMQWNGSYQESVFSYANNINTTEGGTHLSGFRSALTSALNKYAKDHGELKEKDASLLAARTSARASPRSSRPSWPTPSSRARRRPSSAIPACRASSRPSSTPG